MIPPVPVPVPMAAAASTPAPRPAGSMPRLDGLQYLRALAAFGVLCFHAAGPAGYDMTVGEAGVDLFFVLSGFLMVAITGDHTRPGPFLRDRIRRVAPPYWLVTSVLLAGGLLGAFPAMRLTLWHVVSSYLFIPSVSPSNGRVWPLLVPGWTLVLEMFFYALFAAVMVLRRQRDRVIALSLVLAALVAAGFLRPPVHALAVAYTSPMLLEFAAGCWIGLAWKQGRDWPRVAGWPLIALGCLLLVGTAMRDGSDARLLFFGVPALALLVGVLTLERRAPMPHWPALLLLGDASYSLYLWHTLAISVAAKLGKAAHLPGILILLLGLAGGLIAGVIGYRLVERPLIRFFRQRRTVHGVPIPAGP